MPNGNPEPEQAASVVHCVKLAKDGTILDVEANLEEVQAVSSVEFNSSDTSRSSSSSPPSTVSLQQPVWVSPMETEHGRRVMDDLRKKWAQRRADAANDPAPLDKTVLNKLLYDLWNIDDKL